MTDPLRDPDQDPGDPCAGCDHLVAPGDQRPECALGACYGERTCRPPIRQPQARPGARRRGRRSGA